MSARVQDGKLEDGIGVLATEALRVREFGFSASELDRAKKWMAAFYERAYSERDKSESGSFAQEYVSYFLEDEPSPGIEYEYRLVKQLLPDITDADASTMARSLLGDDSRVDPGDLAAEDRRQGADRSRAPGGPDRGDGDARDVVGRHDGDAGADGDEPRRPAPSCRAARSTTSASPSCRLSNGVEAWLKPTDFKNDQVVFAMTAPGGTSLAPPADFPEASLATALRERGRAPAG